MPRARAERMTEVKPEPIEPNKEIRAEAANDNVIELTDVIEEGKGAARVKPATAKFDMAAIKEKARVRKMERAHEATKETASALREAHEAILSSAKKERTIETKTPPKPRAEMLKKSRELKARLDKEQAQKVLDAIHELPMSDAKELPPQPTEYQVIASTVQQAEAGIRKEMKRKKEAKDAVVREGYRGKNIRVEKGGLSQAEADEIDAEVKANARKEKEKKQEAKREVKAKKQYDKIAKKAAAEQAPKKPSFFKRIFGGLFGRKELTLTDLNESVMREEGRSTFSEEVQEQSENVSMMDVVQAWNKSLHPDEKQWQLKEESYDGRNMIPVTAQEIKNRLGIRLVAKDQYRKASKKLESFSQNFGAGIDELPRKATPETRKKAA